MSLTIARLGAVGMLVTAIASPCCFPLFGIVLTSLGFGSFELFGGWTMWVFQGMVLLSLVGTYISYRMHGCLYPLLIALPSAFLVFYSYHFIDEEYWSYLLYAGMFGLLIAAGVNYYRVKLHKGMKIELSSTICCPNCGHKATEEMPTDACTYFYECKGCKTRLKPLPGDCCVFCSYGTVKCPPIQQGINCCA